LGDIGSSFVRQGLFDALIAFANLQSSTVDWNGKPRKLQRGELVTSMQELASLGGIDPKTVSKHLKYLQQRETIFVEKCTTGTFIKINKFEQYQSQDAEGSGRAPDGMANGMDNDLPTAWIHIEELKNKRMKERKNTVFFSEKFEKAWTEYKNLPNVVKGQQAESRFASQIKNDLDFDQLMIAITSYRQMLAQPGNQWRQPKSTFETFLGTKKSGFFWRDFIDWKVAPLSSDVPLNPDYFEREVTA
jgi:hypothetical protein